MERECYIKNAYNDLNKSIQEFFDRYKNESFSYLLQVNTMVSSELSKEFVDLVSSSLFFRLSVYGEKLYNFDLDIKTKKAKIRTAEIELERYRYIRADEKSTKKYLQLQKLRYSLEKKEKSRKDLLCILEKQSSNG